MWRDKRERPPESNRDFQRYDSSVRLNQPSSAEGVLTFFPLN
ncbi:hypothetical protein Barb4_04787 [Bacteroidales bacterium Barb4]|nr:hypothetical protein Barb4_04787 [Bacteroidales bacterium Barb4]